MSGPIKERFIIGRQSYVRLTSLQGKTTGLEPSDDFLDTEDDPDACAQMVVDLACESPNFMFTVFDSVSMGQVTIVKGDHETREELLDETRKCMAMLLAADVDAREALETESCNS